MAENPIMKLVDEQEWLQPVQDKGAELIDSAYGAAGPAGQTIKNALHGVWLGHPLHPAITDIPVGSWTVAAALDLLEIRGDSKYQAGADAAVMLGLLGSVPAALSGLTDWSDTHGKPQRVGAMHGILNVGAAALYAGSYAARKSDKRELGRLLGFLGYGFVIASAYLGGELSYSQKIGVNHAPDAEGELPKEFTFAMKEADLTDGRPATAKVNGTDFFLLRKGGETFAMANQCSHLSGPLSEGKVEGDSIVCPWHGSRFCLRDGRVEDGPATNNQPVLDVKVEGGDILVKGARELTVRGSAPALLRYTASMWPRRIFLLSALGLSVAAVFLVSAATEVKQSQRTLPGLHQPVEILRDHWGVPHIYARNTDDLFFAQGYITAADRLFQLDLWRRIGTGKLSEVLGPNFIARDRIARLVRFRGDWDAEWKSYSPDTKEICTQFTNGINAYIKSLHGQRPEEFRIANYDPGLWAPEDVVSRLAGLQMTGNMLQEVNRAQQVTRLGLPTVEMLSPPDPPAPFVLPRGLDLADITSSILRDYTSAIGPLRFPGQQGSNNWVIDGTMSRTGKPILANDPHRAIQLPSLRKTVHLVAPGWNVIGAGEPSLPGVALGHNDEIAFGFTIVGIDQQDLYVEKTNPDNPTEYLYRDGWKKFRIEHETILVGGGGEEGAGAEHPVPEAFDLKYTDHGPVIYEDSTRHRAYALKWVGELPGTAGYLPALALTRAQNWKDFQAAAASYKVPSENLVYADRKGNIGWIAAGLAPVREGWAGLFPVPGYSGEYEWSGYLNAADHPTAFDPKQHFIATANNNILPQGYSHQLAYYWASPERYQRIVDVLTKGSKFDIPDFEKLQQDTVSLIAQDFVTLLGDWQPPEGSAGVRIKDEFAGWDGNIQQDSKLALIYEVWSSRLSSKLTPKTLPVARTNPRAVLEGLRTAPLRNELLAKSLDEALAEITRRLGPDESRWTWGNLHKVFFRHPLSVVANNPDGPPGSAPPPFGLDSAATHHDHPGESLDLPPLPRPGDANTVNATGGPNFSEAYGASYRQIIDVGDWDRSVMTNTPGESGVPGSPHYGDLEVPWAKGEYHPMPFSRKAVEAATEERIVLVPAP